MRPLQNRIRPDGTPVADPARGLFMGNRGGRLHNDDATLSRRRWVSRQWICCVLAFKGRRRKVWGAGYTEFFFLDEVTAFAAGHRPCFECRRADALAFAQGWARVRGLPQRPGAPEMDLVLHAERLDGRTKRLHRVPATTLPDGACIAGDDNSAWMVKDGNLLRWTPSGYGETAALPRGDVSMLTPPSIAAVLAGGYAPRWHASADGVQR